MLNSRKIKLLFLSLFLSVGSFIFVLTPTLDEPIQHIVKSYNENQPENFDQTLNTSSAFDWDPQSTRSVGNSPTSVSIGDANNDGQNDIVIANQGDDNVSILLWNTTLNDWDPQSTRSVGSGPVSVSIGDANNDGQNNIVTVNAFDNNVSILLWNTTLNDWNPQITRSVGNFPRSVSIGDANNDGQNDIVAANYDLFDYTVSILLWPRIEDPTLNVIFPNPSSKKINLNWTDVGVPSYYIYREQTQITSIKGLNPIAVLSSNSYTDINPNTGTFYYAVIATDGYTESLISNNELVFVDATSPTWFNLKVTDVIVNSVVKITISVDDNIGIENVYLFIDDPDFPDYPNNCSMLSSDGETYQYKYKPKTVGKKEFNIYIKDTVGNMITVTESFKVSEDIPENNFLFIIIGVIAAVVATVGIIAFKRFKNKLEEKEELIASLEKQRKELNEEDIGIFKQTYICLVHKGPVEGVIFLCPHCKSYYCLKCYEAITKVENECWSCNNPLDPLKKVKKYIEKGEIEFIRDEEARKHKLKDNKKDS